MWGEKRINILQISEKSSSERPTEKKGEQNEQNSSEQNLTPKKTHINIENCINFTLNINENKVPLSFYLSDWRR